MKKLSLAALAPMLLLAACGGGDPAESVAAIRQTELGQLDSIASKDIVGIARLYRDDARLVKPDGTVLDGGVAIVEEYGALLEDPNFALTMEPGLGWASADGELAVVTSNVQFTSTDPATGEAVTVPLDSQTVWHRESGSTWKIISAYNVARPAAPAEEAAAEAAE
ncbi:MAG TPA: nuclear transport factor 2 family protein [Paracoccaceae bacterium]|nr:nuclear transport factor 2 family protein [Paracoccaceae bacterium]